MLKKDGSIIIRNVTPEEIEDVLKVEKEAWPPEVRAPKEKFESRMEVFPKGFFAAYVNGEMAAVSTSQIIEYPNPKLSSWELITDNGLIVNSHASLGNALYVVSLGVSSRFQGKGLGTKLLETQKELARKLGLDLLVLGARIPGYHQHSQLSIEEYLKLRRENGERFDPEIRFYERRGLTIEKIIPNYMEDDPESLNYGVVMVWRKNT